MMNDITLIPVEQLMHHPENPRLDLGDLSELTASIKANGVLQNLTVVHAIHKMDETEREKAEMLYQEVQTQELRNRLITGEYEDPNNYWVVIGNRRFEAAMAAGLTELPCVIVEMDRHEQLATMLQENMQRQDLTIYEQSKGIQMMMDLGFDKDEISQRTGFSRSTIERRLAVASLPEKETKEAVECGWDLTDLVEISKIEDEKTQKKLLVETSAEGLRQAIEIAKRDQDRARARKTLLPQVKKFAVEMTTAQQCERYGNGWEHLKKYDVHLEEGAKVTVPEEEGKYYYNEAWGTIEIWRKAKREKHVKSEQEIALEKKQHDAKELNARMRENRIAFVASWKPTRMQESALKARMWEYVFDNVSTYNNGSFLITYHNWDSNRFRQLCGMPKEEDRDKDETLYAEIARRGIPLGRAILAWILCGGVKADDRIGYVSEYNGSYHKDEDLDQVYKILTDNGYQLSAEEETWKDGTHPFYPKAEPDEEPDSEEPEDDDDGEETDDND